MSVGQDKVVAYLTGAVGRTIIDQDHPIVPARSIKNRQESGSDKRRCVAHEDEYGKARHPWHLTRARRARRWQQRKILSHSALIFSIAWATTRASGVASIRLSATPCLPRAQNTHCSCPARSNSRCFPSAIKCAQLFERQFICTYPIYNPASALSSTGSMQRQYSACYIAFCSPGRYPELTTSTCA